MRLARTILGSTLSVFVLSACALDAARQKAVLETPLHGAGLTEGLDKAAAGKSLSAPFVRSGLEALEKGEYVVAQEGFNRALKFDPTNARLHYLNGLTYHLRARAGDTSQREYAAIGYKLALQYDPAMYWAAYQMGHLNFIDQRFRKAQDAFAYALLYAPEEPALLKALATASYRAQDLASASQALKKAERIVPGDAQVLRLAALVEAAGGRSETADDYLERYRSVVDDDGIRQVSYASARLEDWQRFHERGGIELAQSTSDILGGDNTSTGLPGPAIAPSSDDSGDSGDSSDDSSDDSGSASSAPAAKAGPKPMAMVDVVIIRSEERAATDKGINLLSGLQSTLSGNLFTFTSTRTVNDTNTGANTFVNVFTTSPALSLSATYALNILNDNNDHNEVLARPSLIALDGKKSEFFTGAVFHVEVQGAAGSQGSVEDVPVGIKLDVTPKFLDENTVELDVVAARAFIEGRSSNAGFNNFAQVTKTEVTANVAMKFGDTLILSGLSERETEKLNDGVPLLQDIPGIQYLFSHEDTLEFTKSVLILLTPRRPRYTHGDGSPLVDRSKPTDGSEPQPSLESLKTNADWFRPAPNMDVVFEHLKAYKFFREFRTGDVTLEPWDDPTQLGPRIQRTVDFLYF